MSRWNISESVCLTYIWWIVVLKPTITRKMGIQEKIQAVDSFPSSDGNFPAAKGNKNEIQTWNSRRFLLPARNVLSSMEHAWRVWRTSISYPRDTKLQIFQENYACWTVGFQNLEIYTGFNCLHCFSYRSKYGKSQFLSPSTKSILNTPHNFFWCKKKKWKCVCENICFFFHDTWFI